MPLWDREISDSMKDQREGLQNNVCPSASRGKPQSSFCPIPPFSCRFSKRTFINRRRVVHCLFASSKTTSEQIKINRLRQRFDFNENDIRRTLDCTNKRTSSIEPKVKNWQILISFFVNHFLVFCLSILNKLCYNCNYFEFWKIVDTFFWMIFVDE